MSFADGWPRCEKILEMILFAVEYYHLLIAIFSLLCIFAALHCFSQSWFISGTPAHLHLEKHWTMLMVCYPDAGEWMKGMEHVAVRAHPDFFQQLDSNLFGATVICSCIDMYHTIPYSWSATKESAGQSTMLQTLKWRCKKAFRTQFARGCTWCNPDIL